MHEHPLTSSVLRQAQVYVNHTHQYASFFELRIDVNPELISLFEPYASYLFVCFIAFMTFTVSSFNDETGESDESLISAPHRLDFAG